MLLIKNIKDYLSQKNAESAYNIWSATYDHQPGNLMLDLDEKVFSALLNGCDLENRIVGDIGCGTGRHWSRILEKKPGLLVGYDASQGMLDILMKKFPDAIVQKTTDHLLPRVPDGFFQVLLSTLTIAHIKDVEGLFAEWNRVLKNSGHVIITDFHPAALAKGARRTFSHRNRSVAIRNYVHSIEQLKKMAGHTGWKIVDYKEIAITDEYRPYYEQKDALPVFERFKGTPIIYGLHLKKADAAA